MLFKTEPKSNAQKKYTVVSECIITSYQHQVEVFQSFSENDYVKKQLNRDAFCATVDYLRQDLMDIGHSLKKKLNLYKTPYYEEERLILKTYVSDLSDISILLGESAELDIEQLIDKIRTTEYVISQSIIALLEKISLVTNEVDNIQYKLLDIVFETQYALQKFMIFTVTHLQVKDSFSKYKQLSEQVVLRLKKTLLEFKDEIFMDEFIHYSKRSLQFLYKYLVHIMKVKENGKPSEEVEELLSIFSKYIIYQISIISKALNSESPINNILSVFDDFESNHLTTLEEIIKTVESKTTGNETNGMIYHVVLFFTEVIQNIISIEDFGKGFRFSNK